jgi:hypothetical protein
VLVCGFQVHPPGGKNDLQTQAWLAHVRAIARPAAEGVAAKISFCENQEWLGD